MRPRQICRGITLPVGGEIHEGIASMRPRQICRGIGRRVQISPKLLTASMRPRQICRGITRLRNQPQGMLQLQ